MVLPLRWLIVLVLAGGIVGLLWGIYRLWRKLPPHESPPWNTSDGP
jgi:hypothetical protein